MLTHRDRFLELVRKPPSTKEAANLAARFAIVEYTTDDSSEPETYDLSQDYFRFMFAPDVEPTNNHSEQQIRHCVIDRKITQGTRKRKRTTLSRKNVDSHRHVQKTEPQLLFVSSQIHQGQTAKSTGPKPIERNSVNGYHHGTRVILSSTVFSSGGTRTKIVTDTFGSWSSTWTMVPRVRVIARNS